MRRAGEGPPAWLQALPFAAVFVFFFVAPLLLVGAVSLWPTSDYELKPGFTLRQLRRPSSTAARTWPSRA